MKDMSRDIREFSEVGLKERLSALPSRRMVAFSASCAERLLPTYKRYAAKASLSEGEREIFGSALDLVWRLVLGETVGERELESREQACLDAIPSEDEAWELDEPYAEDSGAAVTFSIRAWRSSDPQEAVWAARRVYEALDSFVRQSGGGSDADELTTLSHPLIQRELERQAHDLGQLEQCSPPLETEVLETMRKSARLQAESVFE